MRGKLDFLREYDFEIKHIKGKENKVVDALNKNAVTSFVTAISSYKTDLEDKLEEGIKWDPEYQNLKEKITQNTSENIITYYSFNEKSLILFKNRLDVPNVPKVKLLILNELHKIPYSRHPGYQKMITMLRKEYFWPNMKSEVAKFLARCIEC